LDQWSIQGLWSVSLYQKSLSKKLAEGLTQFLFPVDCLIYVELDEQEAADRIERRQSNTSRFDWMDGQTRLQMMRDRSSVLLKFFKDSICPMKMRLSGWRNPLENARYFREWARENNILHKSFET
jgi:hypothetical protein